MLKEKILKDGRDVDAAAKKYEAMIREIETPLAEEKARIDAIVEEEKRTKQAEKDAIAKRRMEAMIAVNAAGAVNPLELATMPEADFQAHLQVATAKHQEAERTRIAQEEELVRLRKAEEEAKAKEAAALDAQRKEMAESQAKLDAQRKEQEAREAKIREAEEAKRREEEAKVREAELAKARAEAAEQARKDAIAEAEAKAKREAEEKAESERKAKDEAERKAAQASDKEKLETFLSGIRSVPLPNIRDPKMQGILLDFTNAVVALDKALR
jgi:hypothetical protein